MRTTHMFITNSVSFIYAYDSRWYYYSCVCLLYGHVSFHMWNDYVFFIYETTVCFTCIIIHKIIHVKLIVTILNIFLLLIWFKTIHIKYFLRFLIFEPNRSRAHSQVSCIRSLETRTLIIYENTRSFAHVQNHMWFYTNK